MSLPPSLTPSPHHPITPSPAQLLCERCGYPIDGLAAATPCPECGRPAGDSLPARRTGSQWQQRPGLRSWLLTSHAMLRRPAAAWSEVRIESSLSLRLLMLNITAGAMVATLALIRGPMWAAPLPSLLATFTVIFVLMIALTSVEFTGIRLLGGRHGYRITPTIALTVCAHASVGWLISGLFFGSSVQIVQRIEAFWNGSLSFPGGRHAGVLIAFGIAFAGFVLGMVVFSILSGIGYRAMRYANQP